MFQQFLDSLFWRQGKLIENLVGSGIEPSLVRVEDWSLNHCAPQAPGSYNQTINKLCQFFTYVTQGIHRLKYSHMWYYWNQLYY